MTEIQPASFYQARTDHSAEVMRMAQAAMMGEHNIAGGFSGRGGIHPESGNRMQVTQTGSPSMAVIVRSGTVFLAGSEGARQGMYVCHNDADKTISVAAAPGAGQSRKDIVQARVRDAQYSGSNNDWLLEVKTGTPASTGTEVAPANDANGLTLAIISIGPSQSSIVNANILMFAPYAHSVGGYGEIGNPFLFPPSGSIRPGQRIHRTDNEVSYLWNATLGQWNAIPTVTEGTYTPSTPSGWTLGATGTKAGYYKLFPGIRMCFFSAEFNFNGAGGAVAAGPTFNMDLPPGVPAVAQGSGAGNFDWANRALVWRVLNGSSVALCKTADNAVLTNGFAPSPSYLHIGGWYLY